MKPRRWAHQGEEARPPNCAAPQAASLFSNPASALSENGKLFGSAQTRSAPSDAAAAVVASATRNPRAMPGKLFRRRMAAVLTIRATELEHQQLAPARGIERQVLGGSGEAQCGVAYALVDLRIGDDSRPASDARQDRDVLLSVRATI